MKLFERPYKELTLNNHNKAVCNSDRENAITLPKVTRLTNTFEERLSLTLLTGLSLYLFILNLGLPASITDVELEMTRQINGYISRKLFIGRFLPLAGLLLPTLASLTGFQGTEDLLYARQSSSEIPLITLRTASAILGSSTVPLCYLTLRNMNHSRTTATLAASLILFENGMIAQSRYVTPDNYTAIFGVLAFFFWTKSYTYTNQSSLLWPIFAGLCLGCGISTKWTGIFALGVIWVAHLTDTWQKLCDRRNNVEHVVKHFCIKAFMIGFLPAIVYGAIFKIYFNVLGNASDHDLLLSPQLKHSFSGPSQTDIAYGSQILIRHVDPVGGYLPLHNRATTEDSTQQEVTVYPYSDINHLWTVHEANRRWNSSQSIEYVCDGDQVRLEHFASSPKLYFHDVRPQLTGENGHSEVKFIIDKNDYCTLRNLIEDNKPKLTWKALNQKFRLQHLRGCIQISHDTWYISGGNQKEVRCMSTRANNIPAWIVEIANNKKSESTDYISYQDISLSEKFKKVHNLMWHAVYNHLQTGTSATEAPKSQHRQEDVPSQWLFKSDGLKFWNELYGHAVYFILNTVVQRIILLSMPTYVSYFSFNAIFSHCQVTLTHLFPRIHSTGNDSLLDEHYTKSVSFFYPALLVHILLVKTLPLYSLIMSDISGVVYCGIGLTAIIFEACTFRLSNFALRSIVFFIVVLSYVNYNRLSGLTYGNTIWRRLRYEASGLNIDCLNFTSSPFVTVDVDVRNSDTASSAVKTVNVGLADSRTESIQYKDDEDEEADKIINSLKEESFSQEADIATGTLRYDRVFPTEVISLEEAAQWAFDVTNSVLQRQDKAAEKVKLEEGLKKQAKHIKQTKEEEANRIRQDLNSIIEQDALMEDDD
ncbi:Dolichyl-phosphate-mannose-protein mannosyltransferase-domain-containing protein [Mycotypha africana]|uniref:Dolichyl-phosphate-mannose-protein mannosyltransferase-domain-containing protein n=1 Tax=Mycotypha africana TaxID=64632 RepID=UPI00230024E4|nr:Dolichyl-phosphate-mannose-protein mannosyltransferase-domain-containing protein [Mycotypha africana]KAI8979527.1 Dolichyl-phosphate-mannose-protein mannosyltransferase-domain-containing protein [Mycotypha africana]